MGVEPGTMTVTILITPILQQFTDNRQSIEVEGATVRDCLDRFVARYPDTQKWIFGNSKAPLIYIFLNKEVVLPGDLDKDVSEGDVIDLSPVVAGG